MGVVLILFSFYLFYKGVNLWADGALLMDRIYFFVGMIFLIVGVYM
jgi:hypothetical protein